MAESVSWLQKAKLWWDGGEVGYIYSNHLTGSFTFERADARQQLCTHMGADTIAHITCSTAASKRLGVMQEPPNARLQAASAEASAYRNRAKDQRGGVDLNTKWSRLGLSQPSTPALYEELNLVTALVPSETACFASSPGRIRRTAVWISREVMVGFLL